MPIDYKEIFERALASDYGVKIPTDNLNALRYRLYDFRKKDERYKALTITTGAIQDGEIWIVRKEFYE